MAVVPNSEPFKDDKEPQNLPMGVRASEQITTDGGDDMAAASDLLLRVDTSETDPNTLLV